MYLRPYYSVLAMSPAQKSSYDQGYYLVKSAVVCSHSPGSIQFQWGPDWQTKETELGPAFLYPIDPK